MKSMKILGLTTIVVLGMMSSGCVDTHKTPSNNTTEASTDNYTSDSTSTTTTDVSDTSTQAADSGSVQIGYVTGQPGIPKVADDTLNIMTDTTTGCQYIESPHGLVFRQKSC
jgi:hypothetical protein